MNFGDNLKKIRKVKKLSQEELAEKVNVSRQSVSKWETGDAYPEMNNLLELCKIFHCKINDLVNDSIIDVDLLDDEVKTKVVSLKKEEIKKMHTINNIISIIAKIGRIACYIAIPIIVFILLVSPYIISKLEIEENRIALSNKIVLEEKEDKFTLKIGSTVVEGSINEVLETTVIDALENNSRVAVIWFVETGFTCLLITIILMVIVLRCLGNLFDNINKGETPFTLENVSLIKKMAWIMVIIILISNVGGCLFELILNANLNIDIEIFNLVEILFLLSISYVFEYGRLLSIEKMVN